MSEEKMKILKMLEDGRISAEDAARLLESLGGGSPPHSDRDSDNYGRTPAGGGVFRNENSGTTKSDALKGESSRSFSDASPTSRFDSLASDITKTLGTLTRDMEPKLQKLTEVVAEKTANAADRLSKTLMKEGVPREAPHSYPQDSVWTDSEKLYEIVVTPGYNEMNITGLNGNVTVKGYNGDKITAKVYAKFKSGRYSKSTGDVELMKLGSKYVLHYNEDLFEKLSVDAYVPEALFQNISIETNNGLLDVTALKGTNINISNSNGNTKLQNITAENLVIDCNNGRLDIEGLFAKNGQIENFNGDVSVTDVDIYNLKLSGLNGNLTMLLRFFDRHMDYIWDVETSNGSLTVNMPSGTEYGYYIKAHVTLGQIKMGLTGLNYMANSPSFVEAQSFHFGSASKKMRLSLETSNGPLTIN